MSWMLAAYGIVLFTLGGYAVHLHLRSRRLRNRGD